MTILELINRLEYLLSENAVSEDTPVIAHDDSGRDDGPQDLDVTTVRFADRVIYLDLRL